jgi:hypothetical protein
LLFKPIAHVLLFSQIGCGLHFLLSSVYLHEREEHLSSLVLLDYVKTAKLGLEKSASSLVIHWALVWRWLGVVVVSC